MVGSRFFGSQNCEGFSLLLSIRDLKNWRQRRLSKPTKDKFTIDDEGFTQDFVEEKLEIDDVTDIPIAASPPDVVKNKPNPIDDPITITTEVKNSEKDSQFSKFDVQNDEVETIVSSIKRKESLRTDIDYRK